jgi:hypothetical protein
LLSAKDSGKAHSRNEDVHLLAIAAIVCGAWFQSLPLGWHQSRPVAAIISSRAGAQVDSWAANFYVSSRYGISRGVPRDAVYINVNLVRPPAADNSWLSPTLRLPLRLRDAGVGAFEDPRFTMYRFLARHRDQYDVDVQVVLRHPTKKALRKAEIVLRGLVLPRWIPVPRRCGR